MIKISRCGFLIQLSYMLEVRQYLMVPRDRSVSQKLEKTATTKSIQVRLEFEIRIKHRDSFCDRAGLERPERRID